MRDPTYVREQIDMNPEWRLAFVLSEIMNDGAPIGWGRYISTAKCLLANHNIEPKARSFQQRVHEWMLKCFGLEIAEDGIERNHRFLEEALELVQACGCTASEAHQLVDYTFGRPIGEKIQEVGGVVVTLAALCTAQRIDMTSAGEIELARIWTVIDKIRAKQAAKPKHSPLPERASYLCPDCFAESDRPTGISHADNCPGRFR